MLNLLFWPCQIWAEPGQALALYHVQDAPERIAKPPVQPLPESKTKNTKSAKHKRKANPKHRYPPNEALFFSYLASGLLFIVGLVLFPIGINQSLTWLWALAIGFWALHAVVVLIGIENDELGTILFALLTGPRLLLALLIELLVVGLSAGILALWITALSILGAAILAVIIYFIVVEYF